MIAADRTATRTTRARRRSLPARHRGSLTAPHSIHVGVVIPDGGAEGVLVSQGGVDGRFTFFVQGNRLRYAYNYVAQQVSQVVSEVEVPTGSHILSFEFEPSGDPEPLKGRGAPGITKLFIDGKPAGQGELPVTLPLTLGLASRCLDRPGRRSRTNTTRRSHSPASSAASSTTSPVNKSSTMKPKSASPSPANKAANRPRFSNRRGRSPGSYRKRRAHQRSAELVASSDSGVDVQRL